MSDLVVAAQSNKRTLRDSFNILQHKLAVEIVQRDRKAGVADGRFIDPVRRLTALCERISTTRGAREEECSASLSEAYNILTKLARSHSPNNHNPWSEEPPLELNSEAFKERFDLQLLHLNGARQVYVASI